MASERDDERKNLHLGRERMGWMCDRLLSQRASTFLYSQPEMEYSIQPRVSKHLLTPH